MSQTKETFDGSAPVGLKYLLSLPESYRADPDEKWPLLLFLHGKGERGDDLEMVKKHGPPKLLAGGKQIPMIVVSPQCPADQWWHATELLALIDHIAAEYRVDANRIYVTGLSMGGFGTFQVCAHAPKRIAAAVAICGGGERLMAEHIVGVPMKVFHGARDTVVPMERSKIMVDVIKANGGDVDLTIYPDAGHDSWTQTYDDDSVLEWLLRQSRG